MLSATLGTAGGNALIRAITGVARDLGIHTTIEGIETAEQAGLARELGCTFAQGYHWARPVPAAAIDSAPDGSVLRMSADRAAAVRTV